eukprot:m.474321 g.474321  ORF g.474321 m.474321 type:complete len:153 (-) comp20390_c5_seq4:3874-4332(-)
MPFGQARSVHPATLPPAQTGAQPPDSGHSVRQPGAPCSACCLHALPWYLRLEDPTDQPLDDVAVPGLGSFEQGGATSLVRLCQRGTALFHQVHDRLQLAVLCSLQQTLVGFGGQPREGLKVSRCPWRAASSTAVAPSLHVVVVVALVSSTSH